MTPEREKEIREHVNGAMSLDHACLNARDAKELLEELDKVRGESMKAGLFVTQQTYNKLEKERDQLKAENEKIKFEQGITHCLSGHWWVSPPIICPHCDNQKLRARVEKLRGALKIVTIYDLSEYTDKECAVFMTVSYANAKQALAQDDEMEVKNDSRT
jgi:ssDNA-binding Zn-finger/Zn-ribbon topoisomerase 1